MNQDKSILVPFILNDNYGHFEKMAQEIALMRKQEVLKFPFKRKGFSKNRKYQ